MVMDRGIDRLGRQAWLKPIDEVLQRAVSGVFRSAGPAGARAKDVLNGVWLGHPLHPALSDVPLGAWTAAAVMDVLAASSGREELGAGADAAIGIGLAAAVPTAVTGLADWQYLVGRPHRTGLVHGLLNVGAVALYGASLALRRAGARGAGQLLASLGYGTVLFSAYLGGDLVYRDLANVNHANTAAMPRQFTPVLAASELVEGRLTRVDARGTPVVLLRRGERVYALAATCSHLGGPLHEGELHPDNTVTCPWHGSTFAFDDGHIVTGPATIEQPVFETRIKDGQIEVRLARPPA
ncbi:MAG: Rieske 2Fe-2S domain-containing protein [Sphaerobacter sp.]|nr:Rieske 2Fe-2S domain-containing protein [Sphaerobacter sp.]